MYSHILAPIDGSDLSLQAGHKAIEFASLPATGLIVTSLSVVALTLWLPFSPLAGLFGFVPLPGAYFAVLAVMLTAYLLLVEFTKRTFFRRMNHRLAVI